MLRNLQQLNAIESWKVMRQQHLHAVNVNEMLDFDGAKDLIARKLVTI